MEVLLVLGRLEGSIGSQGSFLPTGAELNAGGISSVFSRSMAACHCPVAPTAMPTAKPCHGWRVYPGSHSQSIAQRKPTRSLGRALCDEFRWTAFALSVGEAQ